MLDIACACDRVGRPGTTKAARLMVPAVAVSRWGVRVGASRQEDEKSFIILQSPAHLRRLRWRYPSVGDSKGGAIMAKEPFTADDVELLSLVLRQHPRIEEVALLAKRINSVASYPITSMMALT